MVVSPCDLGCTVRASMRRVVDNQFRQTMRGACSTSTGRSRSINVRLGVTGVISSGPLGEVHEGQLFQVSTGSNRTELAGRSSATKVRSQSEPGFQHRIARRAALVPMRRLLLRANGYLLRAARGIRMSVSRHSTIPLLSKTRPSRSAFGSSGLAGSTA